MKNRSEIEWSMVFVTVCSVLFWAFVALAVVYSKNAHAQTVAYPANLWKGIIAESVSEGEIGMRAVTHCYKNRLEAGMSLGCVGLKRKDLDQFVKRQGVKYERMAKSIVEEAFLSDSKDITKGATHYENLVDFPEPYWAASMKKTVTIGKHTFYKEV